MKHAIAAVLSSLGASRVQAAPMTAKALAIAGRGDANGRLTRDLYPRAPNDFVLVREARGKQGKVSLADTLSVSETRETVLDFAAAKPPKNDPIAIRLVSAATRAQYPRGGAPRTP